MYDELVKRLREVADEVDNDYDVDPYNAEQRCLAILQAANAIEELARKEKFHAFLWNTIQPNEMEQYLAMYRAQAVPSEPPKEGET